MKKNIGLSLLCGLLCLLSACGEPHFLTDAGYRSRVETDFERKKALMGEGDLFDVFSAPLSAYEREALMFLYAYMPLADITNYPAEFHLMNVRAARQASEEMPWGREVPEMLFRHFVLPVRVNNEPLDSARVVFYEELKERVRPLPLREAILEVNHWCHEKAVYRPSDARTSSPLATVRTAYGRCGEESTFLVAALRSVGIPARQVYTPRWAHTDDNHAWVEAWADGQWHFLGACEPEPVLDLGWFNAPASRGMLMHTRVFGRYEGPEEVMSVTPNHTEINVIDNYAPTASATVTVKDTEGCPVSDARVEFKLYNYAEFYTVAQKQTDADGHCSLTAGRGDMLVWASREGRFGFAKLSFGRQEELTVVLDHQEGDAFAADIDIVPPPENVTLPEVTPEQRADNDRRLAQEDSIRNAYVATMMISEDAEAWVEGLYGNLLRQRPEREELLSWLVASRGNHQTLTAFLTALRNEAQSKDSVSPAELRAFWLLGSLSGKDLRDVRPEVLVDHLRFTPDDEGGDETLYRRALLCPRVATEELTPYKSFFRKQFSQAECDSFCRYPQALADWVGRSVRLADADNAQRIPMSPIGVWRSRVADSRSRNVFFVSLARSLGIPAYIDEVDGRVLCFPAGRLAEGPIEADFTGRSASDADMQPVTEGRFVLCDAANPQRLLHQDGSVKYYSTFTLSRLVNGTPQLLSYDENDPEAGRQGTVIPGYYLLVTGTRLASGGVLARLSSVNIPVCKGNTPGKQETARIPYLRREAGEQIAVIGNFDSESLFTPIHDGVPADAPQSILQACGRGYFVVGIPGVGQEPTNHALKDIAAVQADLEKWGRKLVLLFPDEATWAKYRPDEFPGLPSTVIYGIDSNGIAAHLAESMKLKHRDMLPIFIIADTFNRVVFLWQGYTIGLGEQMVKVVERL